MAHAAFLQVIQEYSPYQENVAYYIGPTTGGSNLCLCDCCNEIFLGRSPEATAKILGSSSSNLCY